MKIPLISKIQHTLNGNAPLTDILRKRTSAAINMWSKVKKLRRALSAILSQAIDRVDLGFIECNLSPVDQHIAISRIINKFGLFDRSYEGWRVKRIDKLLQIYGVEFFNGKRILEAGAGHGDIGAFFADLGSEVLCLDGRLQNVNFGKLKHRKVANIRFEQFNLERDFSCFGTFDLLINFGLIYHLRNVDGHLKLCFATADDIVIESVVCDSSDPHKIIFRDEQPEKLHVALCAAFQI